MTIFIYNLSVSGVRWGRGLLSKPPLFDTELRPCV